MTEFLSLVDRNLDVIVLALLKASKQCPLGGPCDTTRRRTYRHFGSGESGECNEDILLPN